jgi:hypothetical protein
VGLWLFGFKSQGVVHDPVARAGRFGLGPLDLPRERLVRVEAFVVEFLNPSAGVKGETK